MRVVQTPVSDGSTSTMNGLEGTGHFKMSTVVKHSFFSRVVSEDDILQSQKNINSVTVAGTGQFVTRKTCLGP